MINKFKVMLLTQTIKELEEYVKDINHKNSFYLKREHYLTITIEELEQQIKKLNEEIIYLRNKLNRKEVKNGKN